MVGRHSHIVTVQYIVLLNLHRTASNLIISCDFSAAYVGVIVVSDSLGRGHILV